jgi:uncharacterized protein YuzE
MGQIIDASIEYSPESDVLALWAEPSREEWEVDPIDGLLCVFRGVDERGKETEEIVGIEIVGFRKFKAWGEITDLPVLWRLPGEKPGRTIDVLKHLQSILLRQSEQAAGIA